MVRSDAVPFVIVRGALALTLFGILSAGAIAATVEVKVSDADDKAVSGATVTLLPSNRHGTSGDDGVVRFDNEAGKGDHKHIGAVETTYAFTTLEKLVSDFWQAVEEWGRE